MVSIELLISLTLVGIVSGLASGLFGIGGGVITVPAVLFLTQTSFRHAVAASLLVITLTTPLGLWTHDRARNVRWLTGLSLGLGGLVGILAAYLVDPYLPEAALHWIFAAFLVYASHRLAYGSPPLLRLSGAPAVAATGIMAGLVAKLLGIGGGILMVPYLVFTGFGMHGAVATSLVAVFTNAASSTMVNLVSVPSGAWILWAFPLSLGAWVGIYGGAKAGLRSRAEALQRSFALLLVLVALLLVHRSLG